MRRLATIQKILDLKPIPNADNILCATVQGWELVVKKDEFKIGDLCVYIEIDSIVPDKPEFEFLRDRKFRVKTIKLRKQISQGLALPLSILPQGKYKEDDDVTEILGVIKYDPEGDYKMYEPILWSKYLYLYDVRNDKGFYVIVTNTTYNEKIFKNEKGLFTFGVEVEMVEQIITNI